MNFISFDLETTGIVSHLDQIVEIGAVRFVDGKPKETYQQLISIDTSMPEQATAINGITDEMLKGQPSIEEILPKFTEFCADSLLVAHNAAFDFQFLLRATQEHRIPAPTGLILDTCQLSRKTFIGIANYKLSTLCSYLKIPSNTFHRAEADALLCGYLFVHILKKHAFSSKNVQELVKISGRNALKFPYPFAEGQMNFFD